MRKIAKWFIAALIAASLFLSCSNMAGGKGTTQSKGTPPPPRIMALVRIMALLSSVIRLRSGARTVNIRWFP